MLFIQSKNLSSYFASELTIIFILVGKFSDSNSFKGPVQWPLKKCCCRTFVGFVILML